MNRLLICIIIGLLSIGSSPYPQPTVNIPIDEYEEILTILDRNAEIIKKQEERLNNLRTEKPSVEYMITDNGIVIQKIQINVQDDNPLVYRNLIAIELVEHDTTWFPFKPMLVGGIETQSKTDIKFGIQCISLRPLSQEHLKHISANVLIGINSSAVSISYTLPKPLQNTSIHIYTGIQHEVSLDRIIGIGVGLFF